MSLSDPSYLTPSSYPYAEYLDRRPAPSRSRRLSISKTGPCDQPGGSVLLSPDFITYVRALVTVVSASTLESVPLFYLIFPMFPIYLDRLTYLWSSLGRPGLYSEVDKLMQFSYHLLTTTVHRPGPSPTTVTVHVHDHFSALTATSFVLTLDRPAPLSAPFSLSTDTLRLLGPVSLPADSLSAFSAPPHSTPGLSADRPAQPAQRFQALGLPGNPSRRTLLFPDLFQSPQGVHYSLP